MSPVLLGAFCRVCSAQRLLQPWDERDGYRCGNCGAVNYPPLRSEPYNPSEKFL